MNPRFLTSCTALVAGVVLLLTSQAVADGVYFPERAVPAMATAFFSATTRPFGCLRE